MTYLEHRGLDLDPDAVLLCFGYNDFLKVSFRATRDAGGTPAARGSPIVRSSSDGIAGRQRISEALKRWSNLYRRLLLVSQGAAEPSKVSVDDRLVRVPAEDRLYLLDKAVELCRQRGIRLLLVVPWYQHFDQHEALLRSFAAEHGIVTVDLPKILADLPRQDFFVDGVHPNPAGHAAMAQAIASVIERKWGPSWGLDCP